MKTRLSHILERHLNGREIAIWGNPNRSLLRELEPYKFHIADKVDPKKHYVITMSQDDHDDFKMDEQRKPFEYMDDFLDAFKLGEWLPFDWQCGEAKIGRYSYFGNDLARSCKHGAVASIGNFCAISETLYMDVNHQMNMAAISDMIPFNDENQAKFEEKCLSDPKIPIL